MTDNINREITLNSKLVLEQEIAKCGYCGGSGKVLFGT